MPQPVRRSPHTSSNTVLSVFPLLKIRDIPCPLITPSCIDGPSLPRDSPPNRQRNPPANLAGRTLSQFDSIFQVFHLQPAVFRSPISSVPILSVSRQALQAASKTANHPAIRSGFPFINASASPSHFPAQVSAIL